MKGEKKKKTKKEHRTTSGVHKIRSSQLNLQLTTKIDL